MEPANFSVFSRDLLLSLVIVTLFVCVAKAQHALGLTTSDSFDGVTAGEDMRQSFDYYFVVDQVNGSPEGNCTEQSPCTSLAQVRLQIMARTNVNSVFVSIRNGTYGCDSEFDNCIKTGFIKIVGESTDGVVFDCSTRFPSMSPVFSVYGFCSGMRLSIHNITVANALQPVARASYNSSLEIHSVTFWNCTPPIDVAAADSGSTAAADYGESLWITAVVSCISCNHLIVHNSRFECMLSQLYSRNESVHIYVSPLSASSLQETTTTTATATATDFEDLLATYNNNSGVVGTVSIRECVFSGLTGQAIFIDQTNSDSSDKNDGDNPRPRQIVTIESCTFRNNVAGATKRSVVTLNNACHVTFDNCIFTMNRNLASYEADVRGGAVALVNHADNNVFRNSYFADNGVFVTLTSVGEGGAVVLDLSSNNTFENCTFHRNTAKYGGAMRMLNNAKSNLVVNCTFENNTATNTFFSSSGGAISISTFSGQTVIDNCTFHNNVAKSGMGGAISIDVAIEVNITNNLFSHNQATYGFYGGGAVVALASSRIHIEGNTFLGNTQNEGGALSMNVCTLNCTVLNNIFDGNTGINEESNVNNAHGGGMSCSACEAVRIQGNVFLNNSAAFGGGFYYNIGGVPGAILWNRFERNHASQQGGALMLVLNELPNRPTGWGMPDIRGNLFLENVAEKQGRECYLLNTTTTTTTATTTATTTTTSMTTQKADLDQQNYSCRIDQTTNTFESNCSPIETCNSHGSCDRYNGTCVCSRIDSTGHWSGPACDQCARDYYGPYCNKHCNPSETCGGFGQCTSSGNCNCKWYRSGPTCGEHNVLAIGGLVAIIVATLAMVAFCAALGYIVRSARNKIKLAALVLTTKRSPMDEQIMIEELTHEKHNHNSNHNSNNPQSSFTTLPRSGAACGGGGGAGGDDDDDSPNTTNNTNTNPNNNNNNMATITALPHHHYHYHHRHLHLRGSGGVGVGGGGVLTTGAWTNIRYEDIKLKERIGAGGFSIVYRGTLRENTVVAIKTIKKRNIMARGAEHDTELLDKFNAEIFLWSQLMHPNIVKFMGACIEKENIWIVSEYMEGGTLEDLVKARPRRLTSWSKKLEVCIDIATAMADLHARSPPVLHRDLKPQNILLDKNLTAKITDFGLSKIVIDAEQSHTIVGTLSWMAPEVIRGERYGISSDVYSFGLLMCVVLTEKAHPFAANVGMGGGLLSNNMGESGSAVVVPSLADLVDAHMMAAMPTTTNPLLSPRSSAASAGSFPPPDDNNSKNYGKRKAYKALPPATTAAVEAMAPLLSADHNHQQEEDNSEEEVALRKQQLTQSIAKFVELMHRCLAEDKHARPSFDQALKELRACQTMYH